MEPTGATSYVSAHVANTPICALIAERTRAGMAAARKRGKHVGRPPKLSDKQITEAIRLTARKNKTLDEVARRFHVERSTLFKAIRRFQRTR